MATKIELPKSTVADIINNYIAVKKRQTKLQLNPLITQILEEEITRLENARNTLTEIK